MFGPCFDCSIVRCSDYLCVVKMHHMKALLWKNFLWMWRNVPTMTFILGLPVAQIILFCLSIGHDPVGLPVAVVNYELDTPNVCVEDLKCNGTMLSCSYLGYLERRALLLVSVCEWAGR